MQDGTTAPPLTIAQPVRDEDRPASRHLIIGRLGTGVFIAVGVIYLLALGSALGGSTDVSVHGWTWGRASLITAMVIGLFLACYGYSVEAANRRGKRTVAAVKASQSAAVAAAKAAQDAAEAAQAAAVAAVEASRTDMHEDHAALHRENVKLREMIGPIVEAAGLLQAYEEQRSFEVSALRREVRLIHELLAVMRQESPPAVIAQQVSELSDRQDEADQVLADVAAKVGVAYTTGFTDAMGGAPE